MRGRRSERFFLARCRRRSALLVAVPCCEPPIWRATLWRGRECRHGAGGGGLDREQPARWIIEQGMSFLIGCARWALEIERWASTRVCGLWMCVCEETLLCLQSRGRSFAVRARCLGGGNSRRKCCMRQCAHGITVQLQAAHTGANDTHIAQALTTLT